MLLNEMVLLAAAFTAFSLCVALVLFAINCLSSLCADKLIDSERTRRSR